jgi:hypothetical protein
MISRAMRHAIAVLGALASAAGSVLAAHECPAVLANPSARSRAELEQLVSAALNGAPVRLADDSLTRDSALIIERVQPRDAAGRPLDGRTLERPEHFRLVTHGSDCVLIHERTGKRQILRSAKCQPAADAQGDSARG